MHTHFAEAIIHTCNKIQIDYYDKTMKMASNRIFQIKEINYGR